MPQTSSTITVTEDSYLSSGANAAVNYGTQTVLSIGNVFVSSNNTTRAVLRASLAAIPAFSDIDSATLTLVRSAGGTPSAEKTFYCRRLTTLGWTETGVTYNTIEGATSWTSAGGDATTTHQATVSVPVIGSSIVFDVTDQVQDSHDLLVDHNVLLLGPEGTGVNDFTNPHSAEAATPADRPTLAITYTYHPVVERIARSLFRRLQQVVAGSTYESTFTVVRVPARGGDDLSNGKCFLEQAPEAQKIGQIDGNPPGIEWQQDFYVTIHVAAADDDVTPVDTVANQAAADAEYAITNEQLSGDWSQFEGLAMSCEQTGRDITNDGTHRVIKLTYSVLYRTSDNDPYTVR